MSTSPASRLATAADLAALPDEAGAEVVGGRVVYKASPSFEHGDAQSALAGLLRFGGGDRGGHGWWLATEVEIELAAHEVYRPDIVGWRRDRVPARPTGTPVHELPDWVCEVLSPSTAGRDLSQKQLGYHRAGVPSYWIVDPEHATVTTYRWHTEGYLATATATRGDRVRLDPFPEVELPVDELFGGT
jgi:Uma2 family endonuclease